MNDYIYEDVAVNSYRRNFSLGIWAKSRIDKSVDGRVEIIDTDAFGRALYIDGALQTTEKDEAYYHEILAHGTFSSNPYIKRVLIIGGGDGGTLREVLKHKVERVVLCEINPDVIELSKKHLPTFKLNESLENPVVQLVIADGAKYLAGTEEKFDTIIVDCNDPSPESNPLYSEEFFDMAVKHLNHNGVFSIQAGNYFIKPKFVRDLKFKLGKYFISRKYFYAPVPSYPSGGIGFLVSNAAGSMGLISHGSVVGPFSLEASRELVGMKNRRVTGYYDLLKIHDFKKTLDEKTTTKLFDFMQLDGEPENPDESFPLFTFDVTLGENKEIEYKIRVLSKHIYRTRHDIPEIEGLKPFGLTASSSGRTSFHYLADLNFAIKNLDFAQKVPTGQFEDIIFTPNKSLGTLLYRNLNSQTTHVPYVRFNSVNRIRTNLEFAKGLIRPELKAIAHRTLEAGFSLDWLGKEGSEIQTLSFRQNF